MSKTLAFPYELLQSISKVALSLGTVYMTFGELRRIFTHIANDKQHLALINIKVKTQWGDEKARGFLKSIETELYPFLLLQKTAAAAHLKTTEIKRSLDFYIQKLNLLKDVIFSNTQKQLLPIVKGFGYLEHVEFASNEDLSFDSRYEEYAETSYLLDKERHRAIVEL